jgi:hypothetical protein
MKSQFDAFRLGGIGFCVACTGVALGFWTNLNSHELFTYVAFLVIALGVLCVFAAMIWGVVQSSGNQQPK